MCHRDTYNWWEAGCEGFWCNPFDPYTGDAGIFVSGSNNVIKNSSVIGSALSGIILNGQHNTVTNCRIHSCDYIANYQAGVYFMRRDRGDPNDGLGNVVSHSSIKGCSRANIQIGQAATPSIPADRIRIEYCDLGLAAYGSNETGNIAAQASGQVEVSHNWMHDIGFLQNCDIALEYDQGARGWIIHHNVCWKGTPLLSGVKEGLHFFLDFGDADAKVYNNTWINSCEPARGALDTAWPGYIADGGIGHGALNMLYARDDTAKWMFANAKNNDYSLRTGSPAINAGKVLPGLTAETTVPDGHPDLGAYEFGQPVWRAGADWPELPWMYPPNSSSTINAGTGAKIQGFMPAVTIVPNGIRIYGKSSGSYRTMITDLTGRTILLRNVLKGNDIFIPTSSYTTGLYITRIVSGKKEITRKIIIKR